MKSIWTIKDLYEDSKFLGPNKGRCVNWGDLPNDIFEDYESHLYTYEKGVDTSFAEQLQMFSEWMDDNDEKIYDEKSEYNWEAIERMLEKYHPGVAKYLTENKISKIRFYW